LSFQGCVRKDRGRAAGFFLLLPVFLVFFGSFRSAFSDTAGDLIMGEACFMAGDFVRAAGYLEKVAASSGATQEGRALYLLGRVHLLTGDFRQSKEFFERAAEKLPPSAAGWMSLVGIGDALFGAGRYEEALRRYRFAVSEMPTDADAGVVEVKIALCHHSLGRHEESVRLLRDAMSSIPSLSGWVGREEDFFRSVSMAGIGPASPEKGHVTLLVGPVEGDPDLSCLTGLDVRLEKSWEGGEVFFHIGPLDDEIQAMILSEKIKSSCPFPVEMVVR